MFRFLKACNCGPKQEQIPNFGISIRLSIFFLSDEYLKIIHPLIYNNLNLIDEHMNKGFYGEVKNEEDIKKY